jgi:hypothetical protein
MVIVEHVSVGAPVLNKAAHVSTKSDSSKELRNEVYYCNQEMYSIKDLFAAIIVQATAC